MVFPSLNSSRQSQTRHNSAPNFTTNSSLHDLTQGGARRGSRRDMNKKSESSIKLASSLSRECWANNVLTTEDDLDYDKRILQRIIGDIGKHAYGIVGISVWTMDENGITLSMADGGFWVDNVFTQSNSKACEDLVSFMEGQKEVKPVSPGEGIAGYLFSEQNSVRAENDMMHYVRQRLTLMTGNRDPFGHWYELQSFLEDEDQPYDEHTNVLLCAGFGKALGVPFHRNGIEGIAVFYARSTANESAIFGSIERAHIYSGVDTIASAFWQQNTRRAMAIENKKKAQRAKRYFKIVTHCMMATSRVKSSKSNYVHKKYKARSRRRSFLFNEKDKANDAFNRIKWKPHKRLQIWAKKNVKVPGRNHHPESHQNRLPTHSFVCLFSS